MGDIDGFFKEVEQDYKEIVDRFKGEVDKLRLGNVNLEVAKNIQVEAYGSMVPLYQIASLSAPTAMTLVVTPWDKSLLKPIAEALAAAYNNEVTPTVKDNAVYVNFPPITKEKQLEYLKLIKDLAEKFRQRLRDLRNEAKSKLEDMELPEDLHFKAQERLDELTRKYTEEINSVYEDKKQQLS